eukprot:359236-Chlamydomonas_euryale.AAC.7
MLTRMMRDAPAPVLPRCAHPAACNLRGTFRADVARQPQARSLSLISPPPPTATECERPCPFRVRHRTPRRSQRAREALAVGRIPRAADHCALGDLAAAGVMTCPTPLPTLPGALHYA